MEGIINASTAMAMRDNPQASSWKLVALCSYHASIIASAVTLSNSKSAASFD
jgi:hypothetical protein